MSDEECFRQPAWAAINDNPIEVACCDYEALRQPIWMQQDDGP